MKILLAICLIPLVAAAEQSTRVEGANVTPKLVGSGAVVCKYTYKHASDSELAEGYQGGTEFSGADNTNPLACEVAKISPGYRGALLCANAFQQGATQSGNGMSATASGSLCTLTYTLKAGSIFTPNEPEAFSLDSVSGFNNGGLEH